SKIAKFFTFWIPIRKIRKKIRQKIENLLYYHNIKKIQQTQFDIQQKIKSKENIKLNIAFFVMYDSIFPAKTLFENMNKNSLFNTHLIVIPDITKGEENMYFQMTKTYNTFSSIYTNVFLSYNFSSKTFEDLGKEMDLICFSNPYDSATHKFYQIKYCALHSLTFHIPYSYTGFLQYNLKIFSSIEYSLFWKIFVENNNTLQTIKQHQMYHASNLKLSGYSKMDSLNNKKTIKQKTQPIIILAPHHTVQKDFALQLSNFLRFSDFYLKLPAMYPNIDFIFRPHPLLFINLENNKIWSKEQIKNYIHTLTNYANVSYENGGDYFESFIRSDALIHDCGSFIAEYLYLDKPECFIFQNQQQIDHEFTNDGKKVLEHLYMAQTEKDIINFIDNIVIKNMDFLKEKRIQFAKENIRFNHPYATQCIMDFIKMELTK
ncbi:hypothetical protein CUT28_01420, partial [Campylobacter coli]|nr:hypothetical protein [Campylobacter coli]EEP9105691.1 hypothetical protein [Campylobacter coli]